VTAPKTSPSEGAEEQGGTACGAETGLVAPERAPDTERAGAETTAGEAVDGSGSAGASPPAVDLAAIKERWAPVFNGFIDLKRVSEGTIREKFVLMLLDVDALVREVERLARDGQRAERVAAQRDALNVLVRANHQRHAWHMQVLGVAPDLDGAVEGVDFAIADLVRLREFVIGYFAAADVELNQATELAKVRSVVEGPALDAAIATRRREVFGDDETAQGDEVHRG